MKRSERKKILEDIRNIMVSAISKNMWIKHATEDDTTYYYLSKVDELSNDKNNDPYLNYTIDSLLWFPNDDTPNVNDFTFENQRCGEFIYVDEGDDYGTFSPVPESEVKEALRKKLSEINFL